MPLQNQNPQGATSKSQPGGAVQNLALSVGLLPPLRAAKAKGDTNKWPPFFGPPMMEHVSELLARHGCVLFFLGLRHPPLWFPFKPQKKSTRNTRHPRIWMELGVKPQGKAGTEPPKPSRRSHPEKRAVGWRSFSSCGCGWPRCSAPRRPRSATWRRRRGRRT